MTTIKPIETSYAGCRFRSRLEARWAVFFDHLGIPWEYEPQGFALNAGTYLPDFWLPTVEAEPNKAGTWFEVKPDVEGVDCQAKWHELSETTTTPLIVAFGFPNPNGDVVWGSGRNDGHMEIYFSIGGWDNGRAFVKCPRCWKVGICFGGWLDRLSCKHSRSRVDGSLHADIMAAYAAGRSARFEHGETSGPSAPRAVPADAAAVLPTIEAILARYDLSVAEGRVAGLRKTAPLVGALEGDSDRSATTERLAALLGLDLEPVARAVDFSRRLRGGTR